MADKRLCFFIGEIGATKTPERARANWLLNEIIEPVIASYFPEFEVRRSPMVLSPEEAQQQILNELTNTDLVIADMTTSEPNTIYQIGMRHIIKRPIVHITSTDLTFTKGERIPRDFKSIRFVVADEDGGDEKIREHLKAEIERVLSDDVSSLVSQTPQRVNKRELSERLEKIANAVANLRINSLSDDVQKLHEISEEVKHLPNSAEPTSIRTVAARALPILTNLFDALGSKHGAQVIIAGAVGGIMSAGGWPAVTVYVLTLAVWQGKDAFMLALDNIFSQKKVRKRPKLKR
jgi:hypothetical protein